MNAVPTFQLCSHYAVCDKWDLVHWQTTATSMYPVGAYGVRPLRARREEDAPEERPAEKTQTASSTTHAARKAAELPGTWNSSHGMLPGTAPAAMQLA